MTQEDFAWIALGCLLGFLFGLMVLAVLQRLQ